MLAGFLSTALEIIIILDICGAIVYFALSGITRARKPAPETDPLQAAYPPGLQPCAVQGIASPAIPFPAYSGSPDAAIYAGAPSEPGPNPGFTAGLKRRILAFKHKLTGSLPSGNRKPETRDRKADYGRLGQVLDSFKEET